MFVDYYIGVAEGEINGKAVQENDATHIVDFFVAYLRAVGLDEGIIAGIQTKMKLYVAENF